MDSANHIGACAPAMGPRLDRVLATIIDPAITVEQIASVCEQVRAVVVTAQAVANDQTRDPEPGTALADLDRALADLGEGLPSADGSRPVSISVPVQSKSEVDLIAALDFLVLHFEPLPMDAKRRAVDWLQAKYGGAR